METATIRSHFPALKRLHDGRPVAYFDGPGGTQVPRGVVEAMSDYLFHHNANRNWAFPSSAETDALVGESRSTLGDFLGCGAHEVVFGANMTSLTYHFSRALAPRLVPGDEIVVTRLDHFANVAPWTRLAEERGVVVREVAFRAEDGTLDPQSFEAVVGPRTRLVAVGWASNALGTIVDVASVVDQARAVGALSFVDAVHSAPHVLPDFDALGCDVLACSPYKFYGPHAGVMAVRSSLLEELDVPRLSCAPAVGPERFESGTKSHESLVGSAAAVDFLASVGHGDDRRQRLESAFLRLHQRGRERVEQLWGGLGAISGVTRYGPGPEAPRTPTVSFTVDGVAARDVAHHLSQSWGVFASHGNFYAANVPLDLGVENGLVRAGCAAYTTEREVERLLEGVASLRA